MKLSLKRKLWLGFGLGALITLLMGAFGCFQLNRMNETMAAFIKEDVAFFDLANKIKIEMLQHRRYEKDFFLNIGRLQKQAKYLKRYERKSNAIKSRMDLLSAMARRNPDLSAKVKEAAESLSANYANYYKGFYEVTRQVQADAGIDPVVANKLMTPHKAFIHDLETDIDALAEAAQNLLAMKTEHTILAGNQAKWLLIVFAAVGLLFAVGIGAFLPRSIHRLISRTAKTMREGADEVGRAAAQLSSSSQSLAEGTSEQTASTEEASSSLEEMSSMTRQNADNAREADGLMKEAAQVVATANRSMDALVSSMSDITKDSEETQKIVKTIDEIAFQTNLLALNAAVEAARAGDAGAGFAVVADEVRNLAMRAAEAAKNTSELIEGSAKRINDGSELMTRTNADFDDVAATATKVAELVAEIAAASKEQNQGIDQINSAVVEMEKVVQQNAATAEESASASEEMSAQAGQMKGMVEALVILVEGASQKHVKSAGADPMTSPLEKSEKQAPVPRVVKPDAVIPLEDKDLKDF